MSLKQSEPYFEKVNQKKISVLLFAEQQIPKDIEATFEDVINWKKSRMYK